MDKYQDIINLSRPRKIYPPIELETRVAQFGSFAALSTHIPNINLSSIHLVEKKILDEEQVEEIKINIESFFYNQTRVQIVYFKLFDQNLGSYETIESIIKKIDKYQFLVYLEDNVMINLDDIYQIKEVV